MTPKHLLVLYHSQSGRTARLAQAVVEGACREDGIAVTARRALEAGAAEWLAADAVVFGSPENFGSLSGGMKDYFDRSYYAVLDRCAGMPYAQFISAGNDGSGAVRQMDRILTGCAMKKVAEPLVVRGEPDTAALQACRELGQAVAAGLVLGIF